MLWDTLERVNRLRQQAMADPDFVDLAKEHELAIESQSEVNPIKLSRRKAKPSKSVSKDKAFSDIYHHVEFGENPSGLEH